jgi:DHA3 family macrolide efflux protein-like MFS transporter
MRFAAPPLSALLLTLVGVQGILPLDVVTAVVAIVPLFLVPIPQSATKAVTGTGLRSVLKGFGEGLRYMWNRPGLRLLVATSGLLSLGARPAFALLPLLVTGHFGGEALELGWLQSVFGVGQIVGGVLLGAWGGWKRHMATAITGTFGIALGFLLVAIAPSNALWLAFVGWVIVGVAFSPAQAGLRATQQIVVRPEMQGRFFAVTSSVFTAMTPLALAITSPLVDLWGVRPLWFVAVAAMLTVALIRRFAPAVYYIEDRPDVGHSEDE